MRANKKAIIWTASFTLITLITCIILYFLDREQNFLGFVYDLSLACFGSALLGVVVAYSAYSAERRRTMESFWESAQAQLKEMQKIEELFLDAPDDLVANALDEKCGFIKTDKEQKKLEAWLGDKGADKILQDSKARIHEMMDQYSAFAAMDNTELNKAYAGMDFVLTNEKIRDKAYEFIFHRIEVFRMRCENAEETFRRAKKGIGIYREVLDEIRKLEQVYFGEKDGQIYPKLYNHISRHLIIFRGAIYGARPQFIDPDPMGLNLGPAKYHVSTTVTRQTEDTTLVQEYIKQMEEDSPTGGKPAEME